MSSAAEQTAAHWDHLANQQPAFRTRFWESPVLLRLIEERLFRATGCRNPRELIVKQSGREHFEVGLSVGCGLAVPELWMLKDGTVGHFILCDVASEALRRAAEFAQSIGVDPSRITLMREIEIGAALERKIDLVVWRNALHHMFDTDLAVKWSVDILRGDGVVYCEEYCGPDRMQFSDEMMDWAERVRRALPERYLRDPAMPGQLYPVRPEIPSTEDWLRIDPSECADSANIVPALRRHAPDTRMTFMGGAMYHLALNDILHNFEDGIDDHLLDLIMMVDELLVDRGVNQFVHAVSVVRPPARPPSALARLRGLVKNALGTRGVSTPAG
ncbi:class I SAM-dependent methyltransferase [Bosea sp. 117]|uniref:class I SAM-dependent methyltransferase n=1 Tax=Bosea sp. 117 TaxID=1125973 RepID=UPI000493CAC9|nr:class I SAM-dependent methyltransferase [Bosea sp. 117]